LLKDGQIVADYDENSGGWKSLYLAPFDLIAEK